MTNDEILMTKEFPNDRPARFSHSGFVILSSLVLSTLGRKYGDNFTVQRPKSGIIGKKTENIAPAWLKV